MIYAMTINGQSASTQKSFDVISPLTGKKFAECPQASKAQVDEAVKAAKSALKSWAQDEQLRRELISKTLEILQKSKETLSTIVTEEQGKPIRDSIEEVEDSILAIKQILHEDLPNVKVKEENVSVYIARKSVGVVAAITPWNFPLFLAVSKVMTSLLMGNTVVLKPAPTTPLATLLFGELVRNVFPPGVFNVIAGDDEVGKWLTQHPDISLIFFTGSVPTGKEIAKVAAQDLKRVILELGGNDPAIVLPDVDVKAKAEEIFWGAFGNCGQICTAIKRLYVHESIYEPLLKELIEIAKNVKVGDGKDPQTQMGPLNNKEQFERVQELVADAKAHGAKIETGGERIGTQGYFYKPTIVTNIKEGVRLVDEEQFGPVLPVMSYKTVEEAILRANGSEMGLGASVWSTSEEEAQKVANQLESGMVWINEISGFLDCPAGGFKQSGIGRTNGRWGLEATSEIQGIIVPKTKVVHSDIM